MNHIKNEINIGVKEQFTVLHMSDTHLTLADGRDNERKNALAARRARGFPTAQADLAYAERYIKEKGLPLFHTGDLIDFTSEANFALGGEFIKSTGCLLAVGNHEFSQYVGEAIEDDAYKAKSAPRVYDMMARDELFTGRIINGVNFVAADDSYYTFDAVQLEKLKAEVAKGLPIVLLMHNPLFEERLYEVMMSRDECAYLTAVPEQKMRTYPESRYVQQLADEATLEFVSYVASQPLIRLILTGHIHFDHEGVFAGRIPQLATGIGSIREITIV